MAFYCFYHAQSFAQMSNCNASIDFRDSMKAFATAMMRKCSHATDCQLLFMCCLSCLLQSMCSVSFDTPHLHCSCTIWTWGPTNSGGLCQSLGATSDKYVTDMNSTHVDDTCSARPYTMVSVVSVLERVCLIRPSVQGFLPCKATATDCNED